MHPKLRSTLPPSAITAVHAAPMSNMAELTRMEDRDKAALRVISPEQPCGAGWLAGSSVEQVDVNQVLPYLC